MTLRVLISSFLEPEYVERIKQVDEKIEVIYEPSLIAEPRYIADHKGLPFQRNNAQEKQWQKLLSSADILFDFDQTHLDDLPELAPQLKWLQATSSGIGHFVWDKGYDKRMPNTLFTTARGVHAQPLAEFCFMVMTIFNKGFLGVLNKQKEKKWERYAGKDLRNRTIAIVGLGKVGQEVARLAKEHRMRVIGVKQTIKGANLKELYVDELYRPEDLDLVLPQAEYLVLITPHTDKTENMMGEKEFNLMPWGSILINIGRGALIDESALIKALNSGQIAGAGLDVFKQEPLPEDSPFWDIPNVIVSPHSASTTDNENKLITDLFCLNLKRYLAGEKLENLL